MAFCREHPEKKRYQNRKRYLRAVRACLDGGSEPKGASAAPIVRHVRVILSLVERRRVGFAEIVEMLAKKGRQHRMARPRRRAYGGPRMRDRGS